MRARLGDDHAHEPLQQRCGAGKIDPAVVLGAAGQIGGSLPGGALHQHALHAADHAAADLQRLRIEQRLQPSQPFLLDLERHFIRQRCRGGSGTAAIEKAEGLIETGIGHEPQRGLEITLGFTRESDDDVAGDGDIGPHGTQRAHALLVFEHRVAALHECQDAIRAALHRQVQVIGKLWQVRISLDEAIGELERMRSIPAIDAT